MAVFSKKSYLRIGEAIRRAVTQITATHPPGEQRTVALAAIRHTAMEIAMTFDEDNRAFDMARFEAAIDIEDAQRGGL